MYFLYKNQECTEASNPADTNTTGTCSNPPLQPLPTPPFTDDDKPTNGLAAPHSPGAADAAASTTRFGIVARNRRASRPDQPLTATHNGTRRGTGAARKLLFRRVRFNRVHAKLTYEGYPFNITEFGLVLDARVYNDVEGGWRVLLNRCGREGGRAGAEWWCGCECLSHWSFIMVLRFSSIYKKNIECDPLPVRPA